MRAKKPKTEATSSTNQKNAKVNIIVNQWELKVKTNLFKARENLSDQVGIGFSFTFNCLRRWCTLYGPITKRCKVKNQSFPGSLSKLNWKLLYLGTLDHYGDDRLETRQIVLVIVRANRRKWVNCQGVPNIYIYIYMLQHRLFILAFCRLSYPDISINYAWMYAHVHKMYKTLSTFICSRDVNEMELFNYLLWL